MDAKLTLKDAIELLRSKPARLIVYQNANTGKYNVVEYNHIHTLPKLYSKRKSAQNLLKRLIKS